MKTACRNQERTPDRPALADAAGGRVSMPFLPTLVTALVLAAASVLCSAPQPSAPGSAARMIPAGDPASLAMAAPAAPLAAPSARPPAVLAFAERYPVTAGPAEPATTAALAEADPSSVSPSAAPSSPGVSAHPASPATVLAAVRAAPQIRASRRLAAAGRRPCPGKRCPDLPARRGADVPGAGEETAAQSAPVPSALPFAETVAEAVFPAARDVGAGLGNAVGKGLGAGMSRIAGGAGDLVRGGTSAMQGSVALLAECLP